MLTGKGERSLAAGEGEQAEQVFAALRPPSWLSELWTVSSPGIPSVFGRFGDNGVAGIAADRSPPE